MNVEYMSIYHRRLNLGRVCIPEKLSGILSEDPVLAKNWEGDYKFLIMCSREVAKAIEMEPDFPVRSKRRTVSIPKSLREYAGMTEGVVLLGVGKFVEIWDEETWKKYFSTRPTPYDLLKELEKEPNSQ